MSRRFGLGSLCALAFSCLAPFATPTGSAVAQTAEATGQMPCIAMFQQRASTTDRAAEGCRDWHSIRSGVEVVAAGNVRDVPTTDSSVVGRVQPGERLYALGRFTNDERAWFMVTGSAYNSVGAAAFVAASLVDPNSFDPEDVGDQGEQDVFLTRCRATERQERDQMCRYRWDAITAADSMLSALYLYLPRSDRQLTRLNAVSALSAARAGTSWVEGRDHDGRAILTSNVGEFALRASGGSPLVMDVSWSAVGRPAAFDVEGAIQQRGGVADLIACQSFGASEASMVYRVRLPGLLPFVMDVYRREAPTASATSTYSVAARIDGSMVALSGLRRDSDLWTATCEDGG